MGLFSKIFGGDDADDDGGSGEPAASADKALTRGAPATSAQQEPAASAAPRDPPRTQPQSNVTPGQAPALSATDGTDRPRMSAASKRVVTPPKPAAGAAPSGRAPAARPAGHPPKPPPGTATSRAPRPPSGTGATPDRAVSRRPEQSPPPPVSSAARPRVGSVGPRPTQGQPKPPAAPHPSRSSAVSSGPAPGGGSSHRPSSQATRNPITRSPRGPTKTAQAPARETAPRQAPASAASGPAGRPSYRGPFDSDWDSDAELGNVFDRLESGKAFGEPAAVTPDANVVAHNLELFSEMAVGYARPLRDFMMELAVGPTTRQWLEIVRPAVAHLKRGATELEQSDLVQGLLAFEQALNTAGRSAGSTIDGAKRDELLAEYRKLVQALPRAFELEKERGRREPVVIYHLLRRVPGIQQAAIDRLYGAGLGSLDLLLRAEADDLTAIAGVGRDRAEAIQREVNEYWRERSARPMSPDGPAAKQQLEAALDRLLAAHSAFEKAETDEDRRAKRDARRRRRARALDVNILLAELGAVDLVTEIERTDTPGKIERIRKYIEDAPNDAPPEARTTE